MSFRYYSVDLFVKTLRCKFFGTADVERWADPHNLSEKWDERTKLIAQLIPNDSRVIEFGAGRRRLESYLHPSCTYFASDLVSRGSGTIVFNLNARPLPDLTHLGLNVAVFGGVLEYVSDLRSLLPWLANNVQICIASYVCAQTKPKGLSRVREAYWRACVGWVNSYSKQELEEIFSVNGFDCVDTYICKPHEAGEYIFVFQKK